MYRLLYNVIGTKKVDVFSEISINTPIDDICFGSDLGYFFVSNQCVGYINLEGKTEFPFIGQEGVMGDASAFKEQTLFYNPTAICFDPLSKCLFVLERNGQKIRGIDTHSNYYAVDGIPSPANKQINNYYTPYTLEGKTSITSNGYNLCWTSSALNLVFNSLQANSLQVFGNGKEGYATSNTEKHYKFNSPSGLAIKDGVIYVSDKGNHCIRKICGGSGIYLGHPIHSHISPEKMVFIDKTLYLIDNNIVYYSTVPSKSFKAYDGGEVISITKGVHNKLMILVKG